MRDKNFAPPTRSTKIKSIVSLIVTIVLVVGAILFYKFILPSFGKKTRFDVRYDASTQTYTISGVYFYQKGTLEIPSEYSDDANGTHPVTAIVGGVRDFANGDGQIESLIIPDSVTSIGDGVFANCSSLKNVSIGNGVTYFGDDVFKGCDNLEYNRYDNGFYLGNDENPYLIFMQAKDKGIESCKINDKARFVNSKAFEGCSVLASVDIPDGVTGIGRSAFSNCGLIKSVSLPNVTRIGDSAFSGCGLESVTLGKNLKTIGNFAKHSKLRTIRFGGDVSEWFAVEGLYNLTQASEAYTLYLQNEKAYSVEIPEGITEIPYCAFCGCVNITSVTIPESVTEIGAYAFKNCPKLIEIVNKGSLDLKEELGYEFIENINVAKDGKSRIERLGDFVFYNDRLLEYVGSDISITLPDSYKGCDYDVYEYAFSDCYDATEIIVSEGAFQIRVNAFRYCDNLERISLPFVGGSRNETYNNQKVFGYIFGYEVSGSRTDRDDAVLQYSDRSGGKDRYYYYFIPKKLSAITIQESATQIANFAFSGCEGITEINYNAIDCQPPEFPSAVKRVNIGPKVKKFGVMLCEEVSVGSSSQWLGMDFVTYGNCEVKRFIVDGEVVTDLLVPYFSPYIMRVPANAFKGFAGLKSVILTGGLSVGESAFSNCVNLETVVSAGERLQAIGDYAFYGCTSLKSVLLERGVSTIGNYAFNGCTSLENVTFENGVKTIGAHSFEGCVNLQTAELVGTESVGYSAFSGCSALNNVTLGEGLKTINGRAYEDCLNIEKIVIPSSLKSIESNVFNNCAALTDVTWKAIACAGKSVDSVFGKRSALRNLIVSSNVQSVPTGIFKNCDFESVTAPTTVLSAIVYWEENRNKLKNLVIDGGETIGESALAGCEKLVNLTISDGITEIGDRAFYGCSALTEAVIPDSVITVGSYAFENCSALQTVIIGKSVESLKWYVFENCSKLKTITVPKNVKKIWSGVFSGCAALESVNLECEIEKIEEYTFLDCKNLKSVVVPDSVKRIEDGAFGRCYSLEEITIGTNVTYIRGTAFENCNNLKRVIFKNPTGWELWQEEHFKDDVTYPLHWNYSMSDPEKAAKDCVAHSGMSSQGLKWYYYEWRRS